MVSIITQDGLSRVMLTMLLYFIWPIHEGGWIPAQLLRDAPPSLFYCWETRQQMMTRVPPSSGRSISRVLSFPMQMARRLYTLYRPM